MKSLTIGNLTAPIPIVQGGMGVGVSLAGLASAVANCGGIGVISSLGAGVDEEDFHTNTVEAHNRGLIREIKKAKELTKGIIGVNIMMALTNHDDLIEASCQAGADILFLGAGLPLALPESCVEQVTSSKVLVAPIISSERAIKLIFSKWKRKYNHVPDAVVLEGPKAGGHLGFRPQEISLHTSSLEETLPKVIEALAPFEDEFSKKIPVIAGGGLHTGRDIYNCLSLGADGVQLGSRFVTTTECDASDSFKQQYIQAKEEDIIIIDSPVGLPGRAIKNSFIEKMQRGERSHIRCSFRCLKTCDPSKVSYCIADALLNAKKGSFEEGFAFIGANGHLCDKIISTEQLFKELIAEYKECQHG